MAASDATFPPPVITAHAHPGGPPTIALAGSWNLRGLTPAWRRLRAQLALGARDPGARWDLGGVLALDSAGALLLWEVWGGRRPQRLEVRPEHEALLAGWEQRRAPRPGALAPPRRPLRVLARERVRAGLRHQLAVLRLVGQLALDSGRILRRPRHLPLREVSATLHQTGGRALGVTALVGALIGIVVSYLASLQLRAYGGQEFIVEVLGIGIYRELGPLLAAMLVAGRSGSAMTAQLGLMRVTGELDALAALGISPTMRLVWPKVVALLVALPLVTVWTNAIAIGAGMAAARVTLGIGPRHFLARLPAAVPAVNFWIGLGKAACFGVLIALTSGHFGLLIKPNVQSLGVETTNAVVVSLTLVILVDALFAVLLEGVGL